MALFVSFEGGEGTGKSRQAEVLVARLKEASVQVLPVHEPGVTQLGEYLRSWLKRERQEPISPVAEMFMFAVARAELVAKMLKPALRYADLVIVADRYADSTTAYQGYGRRLRLKDVDTVNLLATQGLMPDVTFLLDCPPEQGLIRTRSAQASMALDSESPAEGGRIDEAGTRRFEEKSLEFHRSVREGYLRLAKREPDRWQVLDAIRPVRETADIVWRRVQTELATRAPSSAEQQTHPRLWTG